VTVAAVILAAHHDIALREIEGVPNARRLADAAWAGGALPIVVVAPDPDGSVATALAGSEAALASPAPDGAGPAGQMARGARAALDLVAETSAVLLWPARMGWVDAETVTSLIEAHGRRPAYLLRPAHAGEAGWPALLPLAYFEALEATGPDLRPPAVLDALVAEGVPLTLVEVGDPGTVHDIDTRREALPPFEGPPEPAAGHHHEWGAAVARGPDEAPEPAPSAG
jgi:CTP:molybdopterin cytidylyltransferase MocA